jgi:hypothetical protein
MARFAYFALTALLPLTVGAQQTVVMRDGNQISGRMVGASQNAISFENRDGSVRQIDMDRIDSIRFEHFDRGEQGRGGYQNPAYQSSGYGPITLVAGTAVSVRTNERIDTADETGGRIYSAQVDQDVVDSTGRVAIPRGSDASLIVRRLGDGNLALDLQSVSVGGRRYLVESSDIVAGNRREGVGENKRTAEFAGGGAVLGTLMGAIAGGGKGAAIGALAGGAAGLGAEVLTKGNHVRVPAESVLNFRLDSAVALRPER